MTNFTATELTATFNDLTVPLLKARAKDAGVTGYSKMKKVDLVAALVALELDRQAAEDDPIVAVQMNRKDRRDEGRAKRRFSRRVAKVRDQRTKKWGGQVTINLQHLAV